MRGIHSGLVLGAQGSRDVYPGMMHDGAEDVRPLAAGPQEYGTSATGYAPAYRFTWLLRGNYFSPEYPISPNETNPSIVPAKRGVEHLITTSNFSFAMLDLTGPSEHRRKEWKANNNASAAVISDRNIGPTAGTGENGARSVNWPDQDWKGQFVFNDNHSEFGTGHLLKKTRYNRRDENPVDNLFASETADGADAAMVYQDATTYVNQK